MVDGLTLATDLNERFGPPWPAQSGTYNRRPMPLSPGTRLGPYQVANPLGAGGMGEVYAARDTRLERSVAIKVLPREFSDDAGRRARFEREAAAIASLSHPNICTLHDVGQQDGTMFLVMEKLDGATLAARLAQGPMTPAEAIACAIQIAEGLAFAHRAGVVHRDLKPANVMLTKTGAKLLDFGLAKLASGVAEHPTATALTFHGEILGTLPYMAPEQLQGNDVDARADIFAFGAMLHEMVTGQRAFTGSSQASLIGAILHFEPPRVTQVAPGAPPALDRLVSVCLAKDPADRWSSATDVLLQLKGLADSAPSASVWRPLPALPDGARVSPGRWRCWVSSRPPCSVDCSRLDDPNHQRQRRALDHAAAGTRRSDAARLPRSRPMDGIWRSRRRIAPAREACTSVASTRRRLASCQARRTARSPSGRPTAACSGSSPTDNSRPSPSQVGRPGCWLARDWRAAPRGARTT